MEKNNKSYTIRLIYIFINILPFVIINISYGDTIYYWTIKLNGAAIICGDLAHTYSFDTKPSYSSLAASELMNHIEDTAIWSNSGELKRDFFMDTSNWYNRLILLDKHIDDSIMNATGILNTMDLITYGIRRNDKKGVLSIYFFKDDDLKFGDSIFIAVNTYREVEFKNRMGNCLYKVALYFEANTYHINYINIDLFELQNVRKMHRINELLIYYKESCVDCVNEQFIIGRLLFN